MDFLQSKKILWLFSIIGAVAVLVIVGAALIIKRPTSKVNNAEFTVSKEDVNHSEWPDKFPAYIPMEAGAKITENYTATSNDGRYQGTRMFETTKTLDANYQIYRTYFQHNNWQLQTGVDLKDIKVVIATKDGLEAQVTLNNNPSTQIKTVQLTITEIK